MTEEVIIMDISVVMYGGHDVQIIKYTKTYRISRELAETIGTKGVDFNFIIIKFAPVNSL